MNRLPIARVAGQVLRALVVAAVLAWMPTVALAQAPEDGARFGIVFGGVSTFGVTLEFFDGNKSLDVTVGTWSFRDISVAAVAKRYFGDNAVKPFIGGGLWVVAAKPAEERLGTAFVLQAPVGLDVGIEEDHHLGATLNINRALWVRRTDPADDYPLNKRLVPLPGLYYRFERR